jgi:D-alanyl-D-alanine carboxypeptidase/D-alanyl-D-alanine-endopeptidase (penicillin-binding protein 4)
VLKGGADPELGVPQFWALLLDLRQAGVTHIAGNLLVDRSLFRPARFDQGLPPFDEAPEFGYNVIPDALLLAGNLLPLEIKATEAGVMASTVPALPGWRSAAAWR